VSAVGTIAISQSRVELPDCDRKILARPEVAEIAAQNYAEALSTQAMALEMAHEMVLLCREWGFALSGIRVPCLLWHGELDRNVPVGHGYRIAQALSDCCATFLPDAGHYLVFDQWEAISASIAADQYWVGDHSQPRRPP
jgi:pimeloyl-ACP methyl ester carboxylesterase